VAPRPPSVARVVERVTASARRHEMFLPGRAVLVAVSGGPDSMCLLHVLHRLRRLFRIRLEVAHVDHRLRPGSGADAAYVRRAAARLGLPFHLVAADSEPEKGESVEAWASRIRVRSLHTVARDIDAARIAEGHTRDDQAETVLIALVRGTGLAGLAGIRPALGLEIQPLIDVTRQEVEAFCRALHLRPRRDPTNRDRRLLRNAVRLRVLPQMEREVGRDVRTTLASTAELLRRDHEELDRLALEASVELVEEEPDGFSVHAVGLRGLSLPIATRIVRRAMLRASMRPTEETIEAVVDLSSGRVGRARDLPDGLMARREREYVRVARPSPQGRITRRRTRS
jgi:tRNA(Ile)-lysidine synthase